jgi:adenylate cyclase
MVGNIGSNEHFNYTVLGDTVNLASRLEWVNKEYATNICVSEFTYNRVKDLFYFRKLDKLRVKWKIEWVTIYELVWFQDDITIDKPKYQVYEQALELYFEGKYQEAMESFQTNTKDQTSYILADRCKKALAGEVFILNGVYEMKTK